MFVQTLREHEHMLDPDMDYLFKADRSGSDSAAEDLRFLTIKSGSLMASGEAENEVVEAVRELVHRTARGVC